VLERLSPCTQSHNKHNMQRRLSVRNRIIRISEIKQRGDGK
jgi:hypothetical protein